MSTSVKRFPDVSRDLLRRYGHAPRGAIVLGKIPTTRTVRAMGPLVELRVRRFRDGVGETWQFDPMPRLVFGADDKRLWCLGRGFRIDGRGFHPRGGLPRGLRTEPVEEARQDPAMQAQLREFWRTHNDLDPIECVEGELAYPRSVLALGELDAAVYKTDRRDGDGRSEWIHPYVDEGITGGRNFTRAWVCTDATGTGLWFAGGTYKIIDGWLAG